MIVTWRDEEQTQIYEVWWYTYVCSARIWTPLTKPRWSIFKVDATWTKEYAVSKITWLPTENYEFIPSEYADLEYSDTIYKTQPIVTFTINEWDLTTENREVIINISVDSYTNITWYRISELPKLDLQFTNKAPTTFTLSEWLWVKTLYVWVKDSSGNYSEVSSESIELI